MTLIETEPLESPKPHRFTRDEYYRLADMGMFQDQRVERIFGEIVDMAPQNNPRYLSISLAAKELERVFSHGYWIRPQGPLSLGDDSDPEPDIAVVKGAMRDFKDHPTTALLVVEVSDSTLRFDRTIKAALYAKQGIADYWLININGKNLEVRRNPIQDSTLPTGWKYATLLVFDVTDDVAPLARPEAKIRVASMLP